MMPFAFARTADFGLATRRSDCDGGSRRIRCVGTTDERRYLPCHVAGHAGTSTEHTEHVTRVALSHLGSYLTIASRLVSERGHPSNGSPTSCRPRSGWRYRGASSMFTPRAARRTVASRMPSAREPRSAARPAANDDERPSARRCRVQRRTEPSTARKHDPPPTPGPYRHGLRLASSPRMSAESEALPQPACGTEVDRRPRSIAVSMPGIGRLCSDRAQLGGPIRAHANRAAVGVRRLGRREPIA